MKPAGLASQGCWQAGRGLQMGARSNNEQQGLLVKVFVSTAPLGFLLPFAQLEEAGAPGGISRMRRQEFLALNL